MRKAIITFTIIALAFLLNSEVPDSGAGLGFHNLTSNVLWTSNHDVYVSSVNGTLDNVIAYYQIVVTERARGTV